MSKLTVSTAVILLSLAAISWAKAGQTLKLDGAFKNLEISDSQVAFTFTGVLADSSHPSDRRGFPIWDFPIYVEALKVVSTDAICMDHKARKNIRFNEEREEALRCYERLEEAVAAVQIASLRFTGGETKVLETSVLSFYDMAQIRRENPSRSD